MKLSTLRTMSIILIGSFYAMACGNNSNQPGPAPAENPTEQKPPAVSTATTHDDHQGEVISGLYANDLGSGIVDEKKIPQNLQNGYQLLRMKCSKCHSPARPLNAQYVEADESLRAKLLATNPKSLDDANLLKLESDVWRRLVKRMMAKPGNNIQSNEGKEIHAFLVWLYLDRVGPNGVTAESWIKHRKELLQEFKTKYPQRYKDLYENK